MSHMTLCCGPENDLLRVLKENGFNFQYFSGATEAARNAAPGSAVMLLADDYPECPTRIDRKIYDIAADRNLRLFVEFPAYIPGIAVGPIRGHRKGSYACNIDREVITSDAFGPALKKMRILQIHACRFVEVKIENTHMVTTRVTGYDYAPYGLPQEDIIWPILFEHPTEPILISTTKLSHFVSGRYAPVDAWGLVWRMIFQWLRPQAEPVTLRWTPSVRPAYSRSQDVMPQAELHAVRRCIEWFEKSGLFIEPSGSEGFHEGFSSKEMSTDGSQSVSEQVRADCHGEVAMTYSLAAGIIGKESLLDVAGKLNDLVYFVSPSANGPRMDPSSPSYGLIGGDMKPGQSRVPFDLVRPATDGSLDGAGVYYGDDAARHLLGTAVSSAVLNTPRWDERMVMEILANFRTTGPLGFRKARLEEPELQEQGWRQFWYHSDGRWGSGSHLIPHYQAYLWAVFLWFYDKTKFYPMLDRTVKGIRSMMAAFPDGWGSEGNRYETERCRMLLPLSWLLRIEKKSEYLDWLYMVIECVLASQHASGAIRHRIIKEATDNSQYGTGECALIQSNGDPVADLLYATNFALVGLHEAAAVTGDLEIKQAEDKLADFLVRVQTQSETHPELSGAWYRGFDFKRWDYWGSDGDVGWGIWAMETGWTQTWISTVFMLRHLGVDIWKLTKDSRVDSHMDHYRRLMLPDSDLR